MKPVLPILVLLAGVVVLILASATFYTVSETEQIIVTQFGKPVGEPVTEAGLHVKTPFIQKIHRIEKRILEWDGPPGRMPTKDKVYIVVDNFARWRISNARVFFEQLRDNRVAQSRLDDILGSETRNVIAKHDFIEAVRTTKDRKAVRDDTAVASIPDARIGLLPPIVKGRAVLEQEIFANAAPKVKSFGIELMDVRFKRINYNESVSQTIYARMTSERSQIAEHFRSLGAGEAAKILGTRERELKQIESEAYRKVQEIEGGADARATEIYAQAYNQTPQAAELFGFIKTMETYKKVVTSDTSLVLSTDSELFRYLKSATPSENAPMSATSAAPAPLPISPPADPLIRLPSLMDIQTQSAPPAPPAPPQSELLPAP